MKIIKSDFYLVGFNKHDEMLAFEYKLASVTPSMIENLQVIFGYQANDPYMVNCYPVEFEHRNAIENLFKVEIDWEKYTCTIETIAEYGI